MSIAVAVQKHGELVIAADTLTTFGHTKIPSGLHVAQKIRRVGDSWLGATGWGLYDNILEDFLAKRKKVRLGTREQVFNFFMLLWRDLHRKYTLVNEQSDDKDAGPFGNLDSTFLVAGRGGIFYVGPDMSVTPVARYFAIGSGAQFGLGALHALYDGRLGAAALARKAVEAAVAFDNYCGGEAVIQTVTGARKR